MFAFWRSSLPPSAVTASLEGKFLPDRNGQVSPTLLVVTGHVITLYTTQPQEGKDESATKLKYVQSLTLAAPPSGIQRLRLPRDSIDSVVLSFDHDYVSVVRFNSIASTFDTVALFHLGEQTIPPGPSDVPPILRADPQGRCIVVLSRRRYLFMIPVALDAAAGEANAPTSPVDADDNWGDEDDYDEASAKVSNQKTSSAPATLDEALLSSVCCPSAANGYQNFGHPRFTDLSTTMPACQNIRDVQFIAAASTNPTLAFLCEKDPTWAGRTRVVEWTTRQTQTTLLTCSVFWASFDPSAPLKEVTTSSGIPSTLSLVALGETTYLPHNATHLTPFTVPGCDDAVLVQCMNSVVYCERASAFGCYLNKHGEQEAASVRTSTVNWRPVNRPRHHASFDVALVPSDSITFQLAPAKALLSCPVTGAVHILTVHVSGKTVDSISLEAIGVAPIMSCCSRITTTAVFLGSAVGDSLVATINLQASPPRIVPWAHAVLRSYGPFVSSDVGDFVTPDNTAGVRSLDSSEQEVIASNGGPYARLLKVGGLQADPPTPFTPHRFLLQKNDFVGVCGKGAGGQVVIGRQNARLIERTRQNLDCISAFVINDTPASALPGEKRPRDDGKEEVQHLLLATATGTTVIKVTNRFAPLPVAENPYNVASRTILAQALTGATDFSPVVVQVCEHTVTFIFGLPQANGDKPSAVTSLPIADTLDTTITSAVVIGKAVVALLLSTNQIALLAIPERGGEMPSFVHVPWAENVTAICEATIASGDPPRLFLFFANGDLKSCQLDQDGSSSPLLSATSSIPRFNQLHSRIRGGVPLEGEADISIKPRIASAPQPSVVEARFCLFRGKDGAIDDMRRLVVILEDGEVCVYDATPSSGPVEAGFVPIDLFKQYQGFLDNEFEEGKHMTLEERKQQMNLASTTLAQEVTDKYRRRSQRIVPFANVGGVSGAYVCGRRPVLLTTRMGKLVHHGVGSQGPVRGMSPLNCPLVPNGLVTLEEGSMVLATLDPSFDYAEDWCISRHKLQCTPHFVGYHSISRTCFVVTSVPVPFRPKRAKFDVELQVAADEEGMTSYTNVPVPQPEHPFIPRSAGIPTPTTDAYKVRLFSVAPHWKAEDEIALEENELVMCAATVSLRLEKESGTESGVPAGTMTVIAVGTAFPLGEDVTCRGRLLLLRPVAKNGSKLLSIFHIENCKGPVTALTSLDNYLVATVGAVVKMYAYDISRDRLATALLAHGSNFVHKLVGFKQKYLLVGDLFQSVALSRVNIADHDVKAVARHALDLELAAADILYDKSDFSIVAADVKGTVVLLNFEPRVDHKGDVAEARLVEQADIRLASPVTSTLRFRAVNNKKTELLDSCFVLLATSSGEIGTLHPLSERHHRTLKLLGDRLSSVLVQPAGLHPHHFRRSHDDDAGRAIFAEEHIADSDLLGRFMLLSRSERLAVAKSIASDSKPVLNILCGLETQAVSVL